mgnify:CR=1 FL=1
MSPSKGWHGAYQARIAHLLASQLPEGLVITECPVDTPKGTKVPDVGWYRRERIESHWRESSYPLAPDVCVEILSASNAAESIEEKKALLFGLGALEFWTCDDAGVLCFFDSRGQSPQSRICPDFPQRIEL